MNIKSHLLKVGLNPFSVLVTAMFAFYSVAGVSQTKQLDWPIHVVSQGHGFTEGCAVGPDGKVYFSDMDAGNILRFDPKTETTEVWQSNSRTSNGLFFKGEDLYACEALGRSVVKYHLPVGPESRTVLVSDYQGKKLGSPNDLAVIGNTLFFSEFYLANRLNKIPGNEREIFHNRVYIHALESGGTDTVQFDFGTPNGIAVSPSGKTLFIGDSFENKLYKTELKKGSQGTPLLLCDLSVHAERAGPDGMAVSDDGKIYLALFRAGQLLVINSDGSIEGYLPTGSKTTNCVIADDGKTLYITADGCLKKVVLP